MTHETLGRVPSVPVSMFAEPARSLPSLSSSTHWPSGRQAAPGAQVGAQPQHDVRLSPLVEHAHALAVDKPPRRGVTGMHLEGVGRAPADVGDPAAL